MVAVKPSRQTPTRNLAVIENGRALVVDVSLSTVWADVGAGGTELAEKVVALCGEKSDFKFAYPLDMPLDEKLDTLARRVYGGEGADFTPAARKDIARLTELGFGKLPVCVAKTQYSFSDNPALLGAPEGFRITVKSVKLSAGAGFVCRPDG